MAQWYLALRHAHITLAACSVALFTLRGLLMLAGSSRVNAACLTVKVGLLVVYIVPGSLALRPGRSRSFRPAAFVAALVTIGGVGSVALTRHSLGVFGRFMAAGSWRTEGR